MKPTWEGPGIHPAVIAVVRELIGKGGVWTEQEQAAFLEAFAATLKYAYPAQDQRGGDERGS